MAYRPEILRNNCWQLTREAIEWSVELRTQFTIKIASNYASDQLVFVDESAADRRTTYRGYAWAFKGRQAVRKSFFVCGRRWAITPDFPLPSHYIATVTPSSLQWAMMVSSQLTSSKAHTIPVTLPASLMACLTKWTHGLCQILWSSWTTAPSTSVPRFCRW